MSEIKYEFIGIGTLIKNKTLKVPIYQRPYSWEKDNIELLLNDIKDNFNEEEYFLGTIVLTENSPVSEIVDGQQRITSVSLLYACIRDLFSNEKDSDDIQTKYLSTYDIRTKDYLPKLELSQQDNNFYRNLIINKDKEEESQRSSNERIRTAYNLIMKFYKQLLENNNNDENILIDWKEFIDNKLKIVAISVPNDVNAFTIFETLNDRGLALAQIDLLKNYLYSRASNRLSEVQNSWIELASKTESENESLLLTYIKHFWFTSHFFVRERNNELFKNIKSENKNPTQVTVFVNNLKNDLDIYLAIINFNSPFWNDYENKCKNYIETINYFNLEQCRPLIFSILKYFSKEEVAKSLKLIVSWLVRNLIVGAMGGGTLEKAYAEKAKDIFDKKIKTASELRNSLSKIIPQDESFKEQFKIATVSQPKYARFYLSALENHIRGKENPELIVNLNPDSVNLEHILPLNPEDNYPTFTKEQHLEYCKRIGNMTLMKTKENNDFKNMKFDDKKIIYAKSEISLTKSLYDIKEWNIEEINKRQSYFADLAVETWSLKFE
ncbi:DUF262 domain-containing HNH endonuclease family protein [Porphyromonadaceae sp. NP-X]|nr:DUF262 domain-containing HNH endonuclease family protein [Porphyromonadaceae sp. NP-X]